MTESATEVREDTLEQVQQVQDRIAATNRSIAKAVDRSAGLTTSSVPAVDLSSTHTELLTAYRELIHAIDRAENGIESLGDGRHATPKQIKEEHADRIEQTYDGPVLMVAYQLLEWNRRHWLHQKPDTNGSDAVERHGHTANQRDWLNELQEAWEAYDAE